MNNVFFTSDLHFNHDKEFLYKPRGFDSIDAHNEAIIENWNSIVNDNDVVYILGDVMLGKDADGVELVRRLRGRKRLIFGNHDTDLRLQRYAQEQLFESINIGEKLKDRKRTFILSHYPTIVSNFDKTQTINLHGHTHSQDKFYEDRWYMFNCGLDAHNCFPIEYSEMKQMLMKQKEITADV